MANRIITACLLLIASVTVYITALADSTIEKTGVLSGDQTTVYTCHFNRNALAGFRFIDNSIIARTVSGSLLRFDRETIALQQERTDDAPVTYLDIPDSSSLLISYADGRIVRLTPTLDRTGTHIKVPSNPVWFTPLPDNTNTLQILSVSYLEEDGVNLIFDSRSGSITPLVVHTSGSQGLQLTSFFLADSLLWFGNDVGEFGGYLGYYNLRSKVIHQLSEDSQIYGITRISDGSILAYGGISHFGVGDAFIFRLHPDTIDTLYASPTILVSEEALDKTNGEPLMPITHIVDNPLTQTLVVQAYSNVSSTDYHCTSWQKDSSLRVRYRPGRRDAIGYYPAVTAVASDPLHSDRMLYATALDGFITLDKTGQQNYTLPNEPELSQVEYILPHNTGPMFFSSNFASGSPWQYTADGWTYADTFPIPPLPTGRYCHWTDYRLTGTTDALFSLWESDCRRDTVFIFQHNDTRSALPPIAHNMSFSSTIMTPDTILWDCRLKVFRCFDRTGHLYRYSVENPLPEDNEWLEQHLYPRLLNTIGPPWYLMDKYQYLLFSINYQPNDTNAIVQRLVPLVAGDSNLCVTAGCLLNSDTLLLATNRGLVAFDIHSQTFSAFHSPLSEEPVSYMLSDDDGNIWLGGRGLWRWTPSSNLLMDFRPIPVLGSENITALALWKNQLMIALKRGLVVILHTP